MLRAEWKLELRDQVVILQFIMRFIPIFIQVLWKEDAKTELNRQEKKGFWNKMGMILGKPERTDKPWYNSDADWRDRKEGRKGGREEGREGGREEGRKEGK